MGGLTRPSYCYKYVGSPISGYENLIMPIKQIKYNRENENQLFLSFND